MDTLEFLYGTAPGRLLLKPLTSRPLSELAGRFLDSPLSKPLAGPFAKRNGIVLEDYLLEEVRSFNDFFCRRIRPGLRPIDPDPGRLIAPCDGLLSVYPIRRGLVLSVKQSRYRVSDLLRDAALAERFEGGWCWVFRLCVDHYHRYVYPVAGAKTADRRLRGVYHTVRPVALRQGPVFCENAREYTLLESETLGTLLQMEVGAMLVGRIVNRAPGPGAVARGEEKGFFQYGGSTVILLTEPGRVRPLPELQEAKGETPVRLGQAVGQAN